MMTLQPILLWSALVPLATNDTSQGSGWTHMLLFIGLMFFIMYFLMIRPQRRRQTARMEMLGALRKNDRVVTTGGVIGRITHVRDREVVVKVKDSDVKLTFSKSGIAHCLTAEEDETSGEPRDSKESKDSTD